MQPRSPFGAHGLTWVGLGPILAATVPMVFYEYLRRVPEFDFRIVVPLHHFYIVSTAAILAGLVSLAIGLGGRRQRNVQVTFLSLAFMSLAFLFSLHGLATPGFILDVTAVPGIAAHVSIFVTAVWLALSTSATAARMVGDLRGWPLIVPGWAILMSGTVGFSLWRPEIWNWVPVHLPPLNWTVGGITMALAIVAALRYWRAYTSSRFPLSLALVYASLWLAAAQWMMVTGEVWRLSWWIYHFLLLLATATMVVGVVRQYSQGSSTIVTLRGLLQSDPVDRLQAGLSDSVRALIVATEVRDPYTAGHAHRVTLNAVKMGEAMALPLEQLRALTQGGLLHDVGKIEVSDAVLNKPGRFDDEERRIMERHPVMGHTMCSRLGFMRLELEVIRHHHERWDGKGYPDGLQGKEIPLLARILAVADVYDALTSRRSYREPWGHTRAHAYLLEHAGTQFDPRCVEVWDRVVADGEIVQDELSTVPQVEGS